MTNKEVLNVKLYVISKALGIARRRNQTGRRRALQEASIRWTKIHIWTDSRAAIARLQHTTPGSGQRLARCIITREEKMKERGVEVEIH